MGVAVVTGNARDLNVGTRYARRSRAGSHQTYGGWEPTVCSRCGRKLTLKDAAMCNFDHATGQATTVCGTCLTGRKDPMFTADSPAGRPQPTPT